MRHVRTGYQDSSAFFLFAAHLAAYSGNETGSPYPDRESDLAK